jgi:hypothetical protein
MATRSNTLGPLAADEPRLRAPAGSLRLDWAMTLLSLWLIGGVYLDGWAHNHGKVDQSFFTPWHGVLYAGFGAIAVLLGATLAWNMARGFHWARALPVGYDLAVLGALIFAFGGVGDLIWHTLFGIEANIEALISPTHLLLALGATLMITGPLRAAWRRPIADRATWAQHAPLLIALTLVLALCAFFTQYAHPWVEPRAQVGYPGGDGFFGLALGMVSILLQTALLMGVALLALRRGRLPIGGWTLLLGLSTALVSVLDDQYRLILAALAAGIAGDVLLWLLRPAASRPAALRGFAFLAPVLLYASYYAQLALAPGIRWSIHMWSGSIVLAGVVGLLLSYLVVPPDDGGLAGA